MVRPPKDLCSNLETMKFPEEKLEEKILDISPRNNFIGFDSNFKQ